MSIAENVALGWSVDESRHRLRPSPPLVQHIVPTEARPLELTFESFSVAAVADATSALGGIDRVWIDDEEETKDEAHETLRRFLPDLKRLVALSWTSGILVHQGLTHLDVGIQDREGRAWVHLFEIARLPALTHLSILLHSASERWIVRCDTPEFPALREFEIEIVNVPGKGDETARRSVFNTVSRMMPSALLRRLRTISAFGVRDVKTLFKDCRKLEYVEVSAAHSVLPRVAYSSLKSTFPNLKQVSLLKRKQ